MKTSNEKADEIVNTLAKQEPIKLHKEGIVGVWRGRIEGYDTTLCIFRPLSTSYRRILWRVTKQRKTYMGEAPTVWAAIEEVERV